MSIQNPITYLIQVSIAVNVTIINANIRVQIIGSDDSFQASNFCMQRLFSKMVLFPFCLYLYQILAIVIRINDKKYLGTLFFFVFQKIGSHNRYNSFLNFANQDSHRSASQVWQIIVANSGIVRVAGEIVKGRTASGHSTFKKEEEWLRVNSLCIDKLKDNELVARRLGIFDKCCALHIKPAEDRCRLR